MANQNLKISLSDVFLLPMLFAKPLALSSKDDISLMDIYNLSDN
jgi:hypothetical protein